MFKFPHWQSMSFSAQWFKNFPSNETRHFPPQWFKFLHTSSSNETWYFPLSRSTFWLVKLDKKWWRNFRLHLHKIIIKFRNFIVKVFKLPFCGTKFNFFYLNLWEFYLAFFFWYGSKIRDKCGPVFFLQCRRRYLSSQVLYRKKQIFIVCLFPTKKMKKIMFCRLG